ncbi:MAG TPA: tol-pal system protein YbgF [Thermoanaerobaculia bacterium]
MNQIADPRPLMAVFCFALAACSSSPATKPAATPAVDPQMAALQTSMTELLERLDVMNDRISRLEKAAEERPVVGVPGATSTMAMPVVKPRPAEAGVATPKPVTPKTQRALTNAQVADAYRNAIVLYGKNRMQDARAAFQQVFDSDQSGELADNALFWIGETYYSAGDYNNAIRYYKRVVEEYSDQNKAPDAMFKLALAYEKTSDLAMARATLQQVIARYPYSSPAASAKSELNRIKY